MAIYESSLPVPVRKAGEPESPLAPETRAAITDALRASKAPNTLRAYTSAWNRFAAWCDGEGRNAFPASPDTVAGYIAAARLVDGRAPKIGSLTGWLAAIDAVHVAHGEAPPARHPGVQNVLKGLRRQRGVRQEGKAPLRREAVARIVAALGIDALGLRDRAILLLGYRGALRRSEVVALSIGDVRFVEKGVEVFVSRSKGDQVGAGAVVPIPYAEGDGVPCTVAALRTWIETMIAVGVPVGDDMPLFRPAPGGRIGAGRLGAGEIARVVKRAAAAAGLPPSAVAQIAGHSLRSGAATTLSTRGGDVHAVKRLLRHRSLAMAERYVREADVWETAPARLL